MVISTALLIFSITIEFLEAENFNHQPHSHNVSRNDFIAFIEIKNKKLGGKSFQSLDEAVKTCKEANLTPPTFRFLQTGMSECKMY